MNRVVSALLSSLTLIACTSEPAQSTGNPAHTGGTTGAAGGTAGTVASAGGGGSPMISDGSTSGAAASTNQAGAAGTAGGSGGASGGTAGTPGNGGGAGDSAAGNSGSAGLTAGGAGGAMGGAGGAPAVWRCSDCPDPDPTQDDWINGHAVTLARHAFDDHVVIYVDDSVDTGVIDWVLPFASSAFIYMKQNYDAEFHYGNDRLHVFLHQDAFGGGTISSYFDAFSTFRNAVDMGSNTWERNIQNINIDLISHEMAHIVEGSSNGIHESPAFEVWHDSKWAEIFQYDLYVGLGMTDDAQKMYDRFIDGSDDFPVPGTYWFRDWFYPLWENHGGVAVLNGFFKQLAEHFPTRLENDDANPIYTRRCNLGELVHFYSGAAGEDLTQLATDAFGAGFLEELAQAQQDFPNVTY